MLIDELEVTEYGVNEKYKLVSVLRGFDESYDSVFYTLTKRIINEKLILDYCKVTSVD